LKIKIAINNASLNNNGQSKTVSNAVSNQNLATLKNLPTINNNINIVNTVQSNNNNKLAKIPPSIPNYSKNVNMSISGTSVLTAKN
jgi:hypothetical protein